MGLRPKRNDELERQLAEARRRIAELEAELARTARRDHLTETLLTLRAFQSQLDVDIERAGRYGRALTVIAVDISGFRALNAEHGYELGDRVLVELGRLLSATVRSHDLICRVGGDEFGVLLPETDAEGAAHVCRRLKAGLAELEVGPVHGVAVSIGAAELGSGQGSGELLQAAPAALDLARRESGGPVFAEPESGPEAADSVPARPEGGHG